MKNIKLSKRDFVNISDIARREFTTKSISYKEGYDSFLCECYIYAIKHYFASKGWCMKDGKIYEAKD